MAFQKYFYVVADELYSRDYIYLDAPISKKREAITGVEAVFV